MLSFYQLFAAENSVAYKKYYTILSFYQMFDAENSVRAKTTILSFDQLC